MGISSALHNILNLSGPAHKAGMHSLGLRTTREHAFCAEVHLNYDAFVAGS